MIAHEPRLKHGVALTLLPALLAGLGAVWVFADDAQLVPTSAASSVKSNHVENSARPPVSPEPEEHGLTQEANEITRLFGLPITNSMIVTWITALGLIVFARVATRRIERVPHGVQNFWEW